MSVPQTSLPLADANMFTVMLVQALWGAISQNFRSVAVSLIAPVWVVHFVLEAENEVDRAEIEEVVEDFASLIAGYAPSNISLETRVTISSTPLKPLNLDEWRLVFRRRERT